MLAGKLTAYFITNSAAIFSDAAESVIHVVAVGFASFSLLLSTRPASTQYLYGYERITFFSAGFEGAMIVFAAIAILTLGIGIAANTAIFSIVNALFLHPPGMSNPARIVALRVRYKKLNLKSIGVSAPDFADADRSKQIFSSAALLAQRDFSFETGSGPVRLEGAAVSWKWFDVFRARPALGRVFNSQDDQPGANHEVVLAYDTWKQMFGGDPQITGRTIQLDHEP